LASTEGKRRVSSKGGADPVGGGWMWELVWIGGGGSESAAWRRPQTHFLGKGGKE